MPQRAGMRRRRGSWMPAEIFESLERGVDELQRKVAERAYDRIEHGSLEGQIFVITGILAGYKPRTVPIEMLEALGATVDNKVRRNTTALILGDLKHTRRKDGSTKLDDAQRFGIPILGLDDFKRLVDDAY